MKILLALDASAASQAALDEVVSRQWPAGSTFEVVSVFEASHFWSASETTQLAAQRADEIVEQTIEFLNSNGKTVSGIALFGHPKSAIVERAKSTNADFIVMGAHGVSGFKDYLLGSVAAGVLREAPCSVLIVRARAKRPIQKILLATDGSASSDHAAESIAKRPWPQGVEVRVLTVVELILPTTHALLEPPYIDTAFLAAERENAMKRAQDAIASARKILEGAGLNCSESISVLWEPPRRIIVDEAAEWGADEVVLGSHGHGAIERILVGSVSEAVAMHAKCSVEVVRG